MSCLTPFTHDPLEHIQNEVRYLHVLPGSDKPLRCQLVTKTLSYGHICLSYRWDPDLPTEEILINDKPFLVRANVYSFLQLARRTLVDGRYHFGADPLDAPISTHDRLWIDSICIDQNDVREKNHQVGLMGNIFSQAAQVIAWVPVIIDSPGRKPSPLTTVAAYQHLLSDLANYSLLSRNTKVLNAKSLESLLDLFENEYWNRAWVVQELLLSTDVLVFVNEVQLTLHFVESLYRDLKYFCQREEWLHQLCPTEKLWYRISQVGRWPLAEIRRYRYSQPGTGSSMAGQVQLRELLATFGRQRCLIYHDHVYALLALAHPFSHNIIVNYGLSKRDFVLSVLAGIQRASCFCEDAALLPCLSAWRVFDDLIKSGNAFKRSYPLVRSTTLGNLSERKPFVRFKVDSSLVKPANSPTLPWRTYDGPGHQWCGLTGHFVSLCCRATFLFLPSAYPGTLYCAYMKLDGLRYEWDRCVLLFEPGSASGIALQSEAMVPEPEGGFLQPQRRTIWYLTLSAEIYIILLSALLRSDGVYNCTCSKDSGYATSASHCRCEYEFLTSDAQDG